MTAVMPFLEASPTERGKNRDVLDGIEEGIAELQLTEADLKSTLKGLGEAPDVKLDADGSPVDPLARPHTELSRLLWARTLIAKALVGAKFKLGLSGNQLNIEVVPADPAMREPVDPENPKKTGLKRNVLPWHWSSVASRGFKLFSTNSKMRCPTFDLPAGMALLGGACPGATYAQSTVPETVLKTVTDRNAPNYGDVLYVQTPRDPSKVVKRTALEFLIGDVQKDWRHLPRSERPAPALNLKSTVCTYCYATGGKYGEVGVQFAEVARMAFVRALVNTPEGRDVLHRLLVRAIEETLIWDEETTQRHGVRPIRVHSSGDFFNETYADVWLKVARTLHINHIKRAAQGIKEPRIVLWAPTRTHTLPAFNRFWRERFASGAIPPNFLIRPSAYSVGDPAPYIKRHSPTGTKGTSVLFEDDARARVLRKHGAEFGDGSKFDFQCGVYALDKGNKTCLSSKAPDGKIGCRACWTRPDLAVNYVVH